MYTNLQIRGYTEREREEYVFFLFLSIIFSEVCRPTAATNSHRAAAADGDDASLGTMRGESGGAIVEA